MSLWALEFQDYAKTDTELTSMIPKMVGLIQYYEHQYGKKKKQGLCIKYDPPFIFLVYILWNALDAKK